MHPQSILAQAARRTWVAFHLPPRFSDPLLHARLVVRNFEEDTEMPDVHITWLEGRTVDQKRKVAQRITQVLMEEAAPRARAPPSDSYTCPAPILQRGELPCPPKSAHHNR